MWMKLVPLVLMFACNGTCGKERRATVLGDESKGFPNGFDLSVFYERVRRGTDLEMFKNVLRGSRNKLDLESDLTRTGDYNDDHFQHRTDQEKKNFLQSLREDNSTFGAQTDTRKYIRLTFNPVEPTKEYFLKNKRNVKDADDNKVTKNKTSGQQKNIRDETDFSHEKDYEEMKRRRRKKKRRKSRHWTNWSDWSPCSVTCGKGRQIRSRKCIAKSCDSGEVEMGEKTCQLPACSLLDKLFSLF